MAEPLMFKSIREEGEWESKRLAPLAALIVRAAAAYAEARGWLFRVTCIYRTPQEDRELEGTGVHVAWRAVDVRTNDVPAADVQAVTDWINARWIYDPSRPNLPVAYSKPHGTGPHLHIQVHQATMLRSLGRAA